MSTSDREDLSLTESLTIHCNAQYLRFSSGFSPTIFPLSQALSLILDRSPVTKSALSFSSRLRSIPQITVCNSQDFFTPRAVERIHVDFF